MKSCGIFTVSACGFHLIQESQSTAAHLEQEVMAHAFWKGLGKVNAPNQTHPDRQTLLWFHRSASYLPINNMLN